MVERRPMGVDLVILYSSEVGSIAPCWYSMSAVIKQQYVDIEVAPQQVEQVARTDGRSPSSPVITKRRKSGLVASVRATATPARE